MTLRLCTLLRGGSLARLGRAADPGGGELRGAAAVGGSERRVEVPAFAKGAEDRLIPPVYARRWAELVPSATVEILPQAGHMLPYERPEAFAEAVSRFLA